MAEIHVPITSNAFLILPGECILRNKCDERAWNWPFSPSCNQSFVTLPAGRVPARLPSRRYELAFRCGELNRSAVGKTQVSFTSRRPQQLAPSTLTSLLACTNALRRATLRHGYAWRQLRSDSSLRGRPVLFPECAPCPSIQSTLKQKLCPSRLRPPRLHPQGRRGLSSGRACLRPCGYNILQIASAYASGNIYGNSP